MLIVDKLLKAFYDEFFFIRDLFNIILLTIKEAKESESLDVAAPGVYVYIKDEKVIKVGKSNTNSRKRALEHIRDNTGGIMNSFDNDSDVRLLLFNLKDSLKIHWILALEAYFEISQEVELPAHRIG